MSDAAADHEDRDHLRKEAWTMALYVTICLLAALTALENVVAVPARSSAWCGAPQSVWLSRICLRSNRWSPCSRWAVPQG
jgi:hypothetical protein